MKKFITLFLAFQVSLFTFYNVQGQDTIYVPQDHQTIQAAIDAALDGNVVLVDTDTYLENINFNGKAITVASHYLIDGDTNHINNTIIDGSQPANWDNGSVVTFNSGEDSTSVICGFTIRGGTGTLIGSMRCGGGIYCKYAGAKIIHNKIINNTCVNTGVARGGGIGCEVGGEKWIVIRDNIIKDNNVVSSDNNALGGGIYSRYNYLVINNNIISHDSLSGYDTFGGAVYISYTYHTEMTGNIVTMNKVNSANWSSSGVHCTSQIGPVNIFQNEFSYNEGDQGTTLGGGGGLRFESAFDYPVIVDCNRFLHNIEDYGGGFLGQRSYDLRLTNNVFIGNKAREGGAIRIAHDGSSDENRPQLINNTIVNNSAYWGGGAIAYYADPGVSGSSPVVINSIFWENSSEYYGNDIDNASSDAILVYYSNIDHDSITGYWLGGYNLFADPELEEDSIHISDSSPCFNSGIDSLEINEKTYYCPVHDFDGQARPSYGAVDIGADENLILMPRVFDKTNNDYTLNVYPNPTCRSSDFRFQISDFGRVSLKLYDLHGREVATVVDRQFPAGEHVVSFDASELPAGVYVWRQLAVGNRKLAEGKLIKY